MPRVESRRAGTEPVENVGKAITAPTRAEDGAEEIGEFPRYWTCSTPAGAEVVKDCGDARITGDLVTPAMNRWASFACPSGTKSLAAACQGKDRRPHRRCRPGRMRCCRDESWPHVRFDPRNRPCRPQMPRPRCWRSILHGARSGSKNALGQRAGPIRTSRMTDGALTPKRFYGNVQSTGNTPPACSISIKSPRTGIRSMAEASITMRRTARLDTVKCSGLR